MPRLECQSEDSIGTQINMVFVIITELLVCLREIVYLHGITKHVKVILIHFSYVQQTHSACSEVLLLQIYPETYGTSFYRGLQV